MNTLCHFFSQGNYRNNLKNKNITCSRTFTHSLKPAPAPVGDNNPRKLNTKGGDYWPKPQVNADKAGNSYIIKKHKSLALLLITGMLLFAASAAPAATFYANGSCTNDGDGTISTCAAAAGEVGARNTIQAAINQAGAKDVVKVVPYNYALNSAGTVYYENLTVTKEITLEADTSTLPSSGPPIAYWTTIDGDEDDNYWGDNGNSTIAWSGGVGGTLRNLKIEGGYSKTPGGWGAGIMVGGEGTSVVITDLMIRYNDNGIVVRYGAGPIIKSNRIFVNDRSGIVVRDSSIPIIGGGDCGGAPQSCGDARANKIYANSRKMDSVQCFSGGGYNDCEQQRAEGCAAIAVLDASVPSIWGNRVYSNRFTGIAVLGQSAPSIKWNYIRGNGLAGVGLLSAGQNIEISKNWFEKNQRGIGVQSSGDPCSAITITDNDILNHTHDGISSCNAYLKIGGQSGDGNRIYNNNTNGINLSLSSYGMVSYNNILNNYESGIRLFGSEGNIENNLIADNGCGLSANNPCISNTPREYGQVEVLSGNARSISNNLIVGANSTGTSYEGLGVLLYESQVFSGTPAIVQEMKDNLIFRVSQGVKLREDQGYGSIAGYRPGAVDRNLVMAWDKVSNTSAYDLGGANLPGEQTYYYGQESGSYGTGPDFFLSDPNHLTDTVVDSCGANVNAKCPDYKVAYDLNSPLYNISSLGLPPDFVFIDQSSPFVYRFANSASPTSDTGAPVVDRTVPPDTAAGVSRDQIISVYLRDTGDGVDSASVELNVVGAGGCGPATTPCATSGDSSYLKVDYSPATMVSNMLYTINISASDMRDNTLFTVSTFTTGDYETISPYITDLIPIDGAAGVAVDSPVQFKVRDLDSGVNPESITLEVNETVVDVEKTPVSGGAGVTADYLVYFKPRNNFNAGATVNLHIYAEDYDSNIYSGYSTFNVAVDNIAPKDISRLRAQVKGANGIKLSWFPSENIDCDIASYPYTLYIDSGSGYDNGQALSALPHNTDNYTLSDLSDGTYSFKITVKDTQGNNSAGTEVTNIQLATSTEFSDDFEGFYDDFSADLSKWGQSGASSWHIVSGELQVSGAAGELTINNFNRGEYRYTAKVKINTSGADDAAWLLVRKAPGAVLGSSGYAVKIGLGSTGNIGIYELSATESTLLTSAGYGIDSGTFYGVSIALEGNTIKLTLDGNLSITAIDSNNTFADGAAGIWQPPGNGNVSYDDIKIDFNNSDGGIYRYSAGENSWIHSQSGACTAPCNLSVASETAGELLINPLVLGESFLFRTKFNIPPASNGSVGLLARKTPGSAVDSTGYLLEVRAGTTGNVELFTLPGTLLASADYIINEGQDYYVWLIGRGDSYQVNIGDSELYSQSSKLFKAEDAAGTYRANKTAGLYTQASNQIIYDDLYLSADLSGISQDVIILPGTSYTDIQSAVDSAFAGDSIVFSAGSYDLGPGTIQMKEGVSLKARTIGGCGAKSVVITGTNILVSAAGGGIEGLKLVGNGTNIGILVTDASPFIENNEIVSCYDGIRVTGGTFGVSAPVIQNNCIYSNTFNGVANGADSTAVIIANEIYNNANNGIGVNNSAAPRIKGNMIHNNSVFGIGCRGSNQPVVNAGNHIYDNDKQGISITEDSSPSIENNYIYGNREEGITIGCPDDNPACAATAAPVIQSNIIYQNLYGGIAMRSQVTPFIASNEIYDHMYTCVGGPTCPGSENSYGAAIRVSEDAHPDLGVNNIYDNAYAITFDVNPANVITLSNQSISRNKIGIHIGGNSAVIVENCSVFSNYKLGFGLYHNAHPIIRDNEIRHNGDAAGNAGDSIRIMHEAGSGRGGIGMAVDTYPEIYNNNIWGHTARIMVTDDTLGTQSSLAADQVRLGGAASTEDDFYIEKSLYLLSGNGLPQVAAIIAYDGATKVATLSADYATPPNEGDRYRIFQENFAVGVRGNTRVAGYLPQIRDNTIFSNFTGIAIGSRDESSASPNPRIYNNTIYDNGTDDCPVDVPGLSCGGGIGNRAASAAVVHNNSVYNNNRSSNAFGIGVSENAAPDIYANELYSNTHGIGLYQASGEVTITSNSIRYNNKSGISMRMTESVSIQYNTIVSNGLDDYVSPAGLRDASGIRARDCNLGINKISYNTIRHNLFTGISVFDISADSVIGPDNELKYNGNNAGGGSVECGGNSGSGSGDGAVAVRDLDSLDVLEINNNIINSNHTGTVARKDCNGTVKLDGLDVDCGQGYYDVGQAKVYVDVNGVYVDGVLKRSDYIVDCAADSDIPDNISGGGVWGIAVVGGIQGAVIRNCGVYSNNTTPNSYGPEGGNRGGGIFVGPGVDVQIYSSDIYDNGCQKPAVGTSGSSGIVVGCAAGTSLVRNNDIHNNKGDGIDANTASITIGQAGAGNRVYNNGRYGIGVTGGGSPLIAYNEVYQNNDGGMGFYTVSGSPLVSNNYIHHNTAVDNVAGIGINSLSSGAEITVRANVISDNTSNSLENIPAGIGVVAPGGGTIYIDDNVIASNRAPDNSEAGGIGLRGASAANPGSIDNVYITSNRVSNHRFGPAPKQAAISFKWLDFAGAMYIRNNAKDGLGLSANAAGIRFQQLADGDNVVIKGNLIKDNIDPQSSGGVGIEFKNCDYIDVEIDSNILSNLEWSGSGTLNARAVIAFENCELYSVNTVTISNNEIKGTNEHGIHFRNVTGAAGGHVARVLVGSETQFPGTSNNIINLAPGKQAIGFRDCSLGDIGVGIYNNNNLQGGISCENNKLYYLTIVGNNNIYSGQNAGSPVLSFSGIQTRDNIVGLRGNSLSDPVPVTIENNGIRLNRDEGVKLSPEPVFWDLSLIGNTIASNGGTGVKCGYADQGNDLAYINSFLFSGNQVINNGIDADTSDDENGSGLIMQGTPPVDSSLVIARNTFRDNKVNGLAYGAAFVDGRISGNKFIHNGMRGLAHDGGISTIVEYNLCYSMNSWRSTVPDETPGMGFQGASAIISNNIIYNNAGIGIGAGEPGRGTADVDVWIYHNTIAYNLIGIRGTDSEIQDVTNCIVWGNTQDQIISGSGGGCGGGGGGWGGGSPPVNYSDIQGGHSGTGNIDQDPQFVSAASPYDFHINPASPCKDSGTNVGINTDIDGETRPYDAGYDMGADEYMPCAPVAGQAAVFSPGDGDTCVALEAGLDWTDAADAYSYDVYLGTTNPPTALVCADTSLSGCNPGTLNDNTTYYWYVVSKNNSCSPTQGPVWSFTTIQTVLPGVPSAPSPAVGALDVSTDISLSWAAAGNATSYDVYFGETNPPAYAATVSDPAYNPGGLDFSRRYFWKIVPNNCLGSTEGNVWDFTTIACYTVCADGCNYSSISSAMADAVSGDKICVYNGSYAEGNLTIKSGVTVSGESNSDTIISGGTMYMESDSVLDNLKLTYGGSYNDTRVEPASGGASNLTVTNCRFTNTYNYGGSGIRLDAASDSAAISWTIDSNVFSNCYYYGVYIAQNDIDTAVISNNRFKNCRYGITFGKGSSPYGRITGGVTVSNNEISAASSQRYAIRNHSNHTVTLKNNTIYGYTNSSYGYGYYTSAGTSNLYFNTIFNNRRGVYASSGSYLNTVSNCIIWGHSSYDIYPTNMGSKVSYSIVEGGYYGGGNIINCNPRLTGNGHINSDSPAIDNGTAAGGVINDIDGGPRPLDGPNQSPPGCSSYGDSDTTAQYDIGADEYGAP